MEFTTTDSQINVWDPSTTCCNCGQLGQEFCNEECEKEYYISLYRISEMRDLFCATIMEEHRIKMRPDDEELTQALW